MPLTLTVISYKGNPASDQASVTANHEKITVGRHKGNLLVLHDPVVSSRHAIIECIDDDYYVRDTSTNGTLIKHGNNGSVETLGNGQSAKLNNEDLLTFGDHEVSVLITGQQVGTESGDGIFDHSDQAPNSISAEDHSLDLSADDPFADLGSGPDANDVLAKPQVQAADDSNDFSFLDMLDRPGASSSSDEPSEVDPDDPFADIGPAAVERNKPSAVTAESSRATEVSDEFSFLDSLEKTDQVPIDSGSANADADDPFADIGPDTADQARSAATQEATTLPPEIATHRAPDDSATGSETECIQNFLQGAGLAGSRVADSLNPQTFFLIGQLLNHSLQGVIQVLQARSRIKGELGLDVTIIHGRKNNPLKFSPSAQESLIKMLTPQGEAYMSANQAVDEAFSDISAHEMAVMAGMRSALRDVLKRFDPEQLEQRLQKKSPISAKIPVAKEAMLWDQFQDLYEEIEQEAHDDFDRLFGRAFAKAYNDQLRKNKLKR